MSWGSCPVNTPPPGVILSPQAKDLSPASSLQRRQCPACSWPNATPPCRFVRSREDSGSWATAVCGHAGQAGSASLQCGRPARSLAGELSMTHGNGRRLERVCCGARSFSVAQDDTQDGAARVDEVSATMPPAFVVIATFLAVPTRASWHSWHSWHTYPAAGAWPRTRGVSDRA